MNTKQNTKSSESNLQLTTNLRTNKTYHSNPLTLPISTRLIKWPFIIIAIVLIGMLSYFFLPTYLKPVVIASSFMLLLLKEVYGRLRLKEIKKQRYTTQKPYAWKITDPKNTDHPDFKSLKQHFRALQEGSGHSILFIIERVTPEDHQARLYESIAQDLRKESTQVERFFHRGDYELFWTEGYPNEISAKELTEKYRNWLPIFCSDGHRLIDSKIESLSEVVFPFYIWKNRILLTNRPGFSWSYEEELLSVVFSIFSFNLSGVKAISELSNRRAGLYPCNQLDEKLELILKDDEQEIPEKLESHYGKELTQWIAATALCSKLDWDLTLKIGEYLSIHYQTLNNHTQLRQLGRLGWFRVGEMPEQVRKQLIQYLPIPFQNEIRRLIVEAMEKSVPPYPSHAHNSYRMELVSHKLLIPDFPQKGLKEEFYELKSMGYLEEVGATNSIKDHGQINESINLYNAGGPLFGWNLKLLIPLLFVLSGAFAMAVDLVVSSTPPPEISLHGSVKDFTGNTVEKVTIMSEFGTTLTDENGYFKLRRSERMLDQSFEVIAKKTGYFNQPLIIQPEQKQVDINLAPSTVSIKILDNASRNNKIKNAKVTLLTNAKSENSVYSNEHGMAILPLKKIYQPTDKFRLVIEKNGFESQEGSFQYNSLNKTVYLEEEELVDEIDFIGSVENPCEKAVDKVRVEISGYPAVYTDESGAFSLKLPLKKLKEPILVNFSKDDYYSKNEVEYTISDLKARKTIRLTPKTITIKVIEEESKNRVNEAQLLINNSIKKITNEWGKTKASLNRNAGCEVEIIIADDRYAYSEDAYKIKEGEIIVTLKNKAPEFNYYIKEKCGEGLNDLSIVINDDTKTDITTSQGKIDLKVKDHKEKINVKIIKKGFHELSETYEIKDLKNRKTFELSRRWINLKIVNQKNPEVGLAGVAVRFKDGKKGTTDDQGEIRFEVEKSFDCEQKLYLEHKDYKTYNEPLNLTLGSETIALAPVAAKEDFILKVNVKENKTFLSDVKVMAHDNQSNFEFKEVKTGSFEYIVKEKEQPKLYSSLEKGNFLSITCSKSGYCEKMNRDALSKNKTSISVSMDHYFKNFKMEVTREGVPLRAVVFRYKDILLKTTQIEPRLYVLVRGDPKNDAIIKAIDRRENLVVQASFNIDSPQGGLKNSVEKLVNLKHFCANEIVKFNFKK